MVYEPEPDPNELRVPYGEVPAKPVVEVEEDVDIPVEDDLEAELEDDDDDDEFEDDDDDDIITEEEDEEKS